MFVERWYICEDLAMVLYKHILVMGCCKVGQCYNNGLFESLVSCITFNEYYNTLAKFRMEY